jgi:hypothetical protein
MAKKKITDEEYLAIKHYDIAAIRSTSFVVGKHYTVTSPNNKEEISVRCSQSVPYVLTKI